MSPFEFSNVLVPVDGSQESGKALDCALSICTALDARLTVLAVEGKLPAYAASLGAVFANLGVLGVLFGAKMVPKIGLVLPLARRHVPEHATFTTLLMSTGLTFGTISSLYGLNAGIIDRTQFSLLVTVVVLSAIVPTAIAQRRFSPDVEAERVGARPSAHPHPTAVPAAEHA